MKTKLRVAVVLTLVVLLVAGCSSSASSSKVTSSPSPKVKVAAAASPSPAGMTDAQWAIAWLLWGLNTPPPRNLETLVKEPLPATAQNLTNISSVPVPNQVSDADVAKWLAAYERTSSIKNYLVTHLNAQALQSGPLADPSKTADVYYGALKLITAAKQAGATALAYTVPFTIQAVGVAFVPEALRTAATGPLRDFPLSEYVFVLRLAGPGQTDQVFADGHKVAVVQAPAGAQGNFLAAGQYKVDPVLGPLWYGQTELNCQDFPSLQSVCGLIP